MTTNYQNVGVELYSCTVAFSCSHFPIVYTTVGPTFTAVFEQAVTHTAKTEKEHLRWIELSAYRGLVERDGYHTDAMGRSIKVEKYALTVPIGPNFRVRLGSLEQTRAEQAAQQSTAAILQLKNSQEKPVSAPPVSPNFASSRRRPSPITLGDELGSDNEEAFDVPPSAPVRSGKGKTSLASSQKKQKKKN
jgi:hypothetical protein